jgi:hypothetical protein
MAKRAKRAVLTASESKDGTVTASLAASPRLDFGVSPNCASRLREC